MRELTISGKKPLCPQCRHRHLTGEAVGWFDELDGLWRCYRCDAPIDADGCRVSRCPRCYKKLTVSPLVHAIQTGCGREAPQRRKRAAVSQRGYVPPSRAHMMPRDEYLASVRVSREDKLAAHRERQARYQARKKAS